MQKNNENNLTQDDQPPGGLAVSISAYLKELAEKSAGVRKQFYPSYLEKRCSAKSLSDPLLEDEYTRVRGLVHKYKSRVLILLTLSCASYCRFCTRRRFVGDLKKGILSRSDINQMATYLKNHPEVNEVIFSGGDPLTAPLLLEYALKKITVLPKIKIVRIHTRVPISNPKLITPKVISILKSVTKQPLYVSLHFEHPDELTPQTIEAVNKIRKTGAILISQSVFLRNVNDTYRTLKRLFNRLSELGIRPYYIYHCDPVVGAEHFIVPLKKEVKIMTKLRKNLSGIACPLFCIDTPGGSGKIPVPLNFWKFDSRTFKDFEGKRITVIG